MDSSLVLASERPISRASDADDDHGDHDDDHDTGADDADNLDDGADNDCHWMMVTTWTGANLVTQSIQLH